MIPLLLLGAGLAGFMLGKKKPTKVGKVQSRSVLKEQRRRHEAWQALRQAFRKGLSETLAVATAKTVYKTMGGTDVAFIARLDSYDKKSLQVGATASSTRRAARQSDRKKRNNPPPPPAPKQKPVIKQRRRFVAQQPGQNDENEADLAAREQELAEREQALAEGGGQGQGQEQAQSQAPAASQAAPQEEEAPEEGGDIPSEETTAALAFTRAKDEGDDTEKARAKAKAVYQAMGGKDSSFLDMISGWSEE